MSDFGAISGKRSAQVRSRILPVRSAVLLPLVLFGLNCTTSPSDDSDGELPPRTDGQPETLRIATWNVENFPKNAATPQLLAESILALELDLMAIQEVADEDAFWDLVEDLPLYAGTLSPHEYFDGSYQKVGFLYRSDKLQVGNIRVLFDHDGFSFPRPAYQATVTSRTTGADFFAITLHLKAGRGNDNRERRISAAQELADHALKLATTDDDIVLLGDFNDVLTSNAGRSVFEPFLSAGFDIVTDELSDEGAYSFVPSMVMLDHIVASSALTGEIVSESDSIPQLDFAIRNYDASLSDHLPVTFDITPIAD